MTQINMTAFGLSERFAVLTTEYLNLITGRIVIRALASYQKLNSENAYAEDAGSYLIAKEKKRKNIAKIVKTEKAKGTIRR